MQMQRYRTRSAQHLAALYLTANCHHNVDCRPTAALEQTHIAIAQTNKEGQDKVDESDEFLMVEVGDFTLRTGAQNVPMPPNSYHKILQGYEEIT